MIFLKSKWYVYRLTGAGRGLVKKKPLKAKMDAKLYLANYKSAYVGWTIDKGEYLNTQKITWEVI